MADHDKYLTGSGVSRYLRPGERSWGAVIHRTGTPVLDSELNLDQEVRSTFDRVLAQHQSPSGWLKGTARRDTYDAFVTPNPGSPVFVTDGFYMRKRYAVVNNWPIVVEYTGTPVADINLIQLDSAPVAGGAPPDIKRTDFVFLEVWQRVISDSPNASGQITLNLNSTAGDIFNIAGFALTAVGGAPGVDQFQVGGAATVTAANIASAINNPANSYSGTVAASATGTVVTVRANVSGTAGNVVPFALGVEIVPATYTFNPGGGFLTGGVDETGKPGQDLIYRHGNVDSPSAVAWADDIADPTIWGETTKRIQVQYRIRVTGQSEAVNFKTEADGFSNTAVLAQGSQSAPVVNYPFVPADLTTVSGNSDATAYDIEDAGLWIAGDGSSAAATALGTVDGYVYAIPICFVFRRNDASGIAGFDPLNNTNGALSESHGGFVNPAVGIIPAGDSDRPDGAYHDAIRATDILDLRRHVALMGHDLASELDFQMKSLLDGNFQTWAIDAADKQVLGSGSGDVSTRFLVCNQIGRSSAAGGVPPISGDTTRGDTVRNFDHIARRFGDSAVVERAVFALLPTDNVGINPGKYVVQATPAYSGWAEDDVIHLDLSTVNASTDGSVVDAGAAPAPTNPGAISFFVPPGTTITDVGLITHDDGNFGGAVSQSVQVKTITGLGTQYLQITLDRNDDVVNGGNPLNPPTRMVGDTGLDDGSQRRIFVEIEYSYPLGSGLTDTPDVSLSPDTTVYPDGPVLENTTAQRPSDWEDLRSPRFREGKREAAIEYVANQPGSGIGSGTPINDNFVSNGPFMIRTLRRLFGSGALLTGITDVPAFAPVPVDNLLTEYGSSSRQLYSAIPLSGAQTEVDVTYFGQDAIPNYGAPGGGYQVGIYYRSNAPQTVGVMAGALTTLDDPVTVEPLLMAKGIWSGTVGPGSADIGYPYATPLDQIACNDMGSGSHPADWYFAATAQISIDDFDAETGLLLLHTVVPADGTAGLTFNTAAKDAEFRAHYRVADTSSYRPTAFAQNLSNVTRHKVFTPFLARATSDTVLYRKDEVLLVVLSRFAELDDENTIRFVDTNNRTCAALYRTRGLLLVVGQ